MRTAAPSSFDPDPIPAHARATLESLYGQSSVPPITGFTATAGTRYDHHNKFGSETTFAANAVYSTNGGATTLRAMYDEGLKAPSLWSGERVVGDKGSRQCRVR